MSSKKFPLNKMAFLSFIFGILAFVFGLSFLALHFILLSVCFAYLAKRQIRESGFFQKGNVFATAGIIFSLITLGTAKMDLFAYSQIREKFHVGVCMTNLKTIGEALYFYSADNEGYLPDRLSLLYPKYIPQPQIFWCPSDRDPKPVTIDNDIPDGKNSALISYQYNSGHRDSDSSQTPIAWDNGCAGKYDNHGTAGGNVLYLNGSVYWHSSGNRGWKSCKHGEAFPGP